MSSSNSNPNRLPDLLREFAHPGMLALAHFLIARGDLELAVATAYAVAPKCV